MSVFGVYFYRCHVLICGTSRSYLFVLDASMTNFMFIDVVPLIICTQGILHVVVLCTVFLQRSFFQNNSRRNIIRVSNSLDPEQTLLSNYLQRLPAEKHKYAKCQTLVLINIRQCLSVLIHHFTVSYIFLTSFLNQVQRCNQPCIYKGL